MTDTEPQIRNMYITFCACRDLLLHYNSVQLICTFLMFVDVYFLRGLLDSDAYLSSDEPTQITLELRPLTNASWAHVQGLSQNPRLRYPTTYIICSIFKYCVYYFTIQNNHGSI